MDCWLSDELELSLESRVLSIGEAVADAWGLIAAARTAMGRLIGATAGAKNLTLVARNTTDSI